MRTGYYEGKLDEYIIGNSFPIMPTYHCVNIFQCGLNLIKVSCRIYNRRIYRIEIIISPNGNTTEIDYFNGYDVHFVIMKPSYYNFLYSNIERIISDGSELELGRFIHTEFVKLVKHHSEYGNIDD
jgi:hypothetical protein